MLDSAQMVGFLSSTDYEKARAFHQVRITKSPGFTPARGTVLGWEVRDMEAAVDTLRAGGVVFEAYPFIEDKERCIWPTPGGDKVA